MMKLICDNCKKEYESQFKTKCCSRECSNKLKFKNSREERKCLVCETVFVERKKVEKTICSDECRKKWGAVEENKKNRIKKSQEVLLEKYGSTTPFSDLEVQKKSRESFSKIDKIEFVNKIKQTKKEKYGDENYNNLEKSFLTKINNFGDKNYNNREKSKQTSLNVFGEDHAMKTEEVQKKRYDTFLERYGVKHPFLNKEIMDGMRETLKEKYGVDNISQLLANKIKVSKTRKLSLKTTKQYEIYEGLAELNLKLKEEFTGFANPKFDGNNLIKYSFSCLTCSHEFEGTFSNYEAPLCRKCNPITMSLSSLEVKNFLELNNIDFVIGDRKQICPYEIDFFIPSKNIGIEVNGNYYHSENGGGRGRNYHITKTKNANKKQIKLIHIFEDEILFKKDIVFSRLESIFGISQVAINARKTEIKELSKQEKTTFFNDNHIQGDANNKVVCYGLFSNGVLVSAISFSGRRKSLGKLQEEGSYELLRFCNKLNYNVRGGFSKLLQHFIKNNKPKHITTYATISWSGVDPDKTVYNKNGFKFTGITNPDYYYVSKKNYLDRKHRFKFRKDVLVKLVGNVSGVEALSEWDLAQIVGLDRIWSCGNLKFELKS